MAHRESTCIGRAQALGERVGRVHALGERVGRVHALGERMYWASEWRTQEGGGANGRASSRAANLGGTLTFRQWR